MHHFTLSIAAILVSAHLTSAFSIQRLSRPSSSTIRHFLGNANNSNFSPRDIVESYRRRASVALLYKSKPYDDEADEVATTTATASVTTSGTQSEPKPKLSRVRSSSADTKVMTVDTLKELKSALDVNKEMGRVVIVRFFSHFCKSCQAVTPKYNRLARLNPNVRFIDVAITKENPDVQQDMNVYAVPSGHIYHPTLGLVEELRMSKSYWSDFEDIFYSYMNGMCDVTGPDYENPLGKVREANL